METNLCIIFIEEKPNTLKKTLFLILLATSLAFAQKTTLSPQAELSVITCGPGEGELYASFGHSAFRVLDISNRIDRVYNYGTFNFDTPNFYMKFARGKLLYELRAYNFGQFLQSYHRENRWVKGQVLDLEQDELQAVFDFLENNARPENRSYKYDFFYDNCSTKLYDVLEEVLGDRLIFNKPFDQLEYTHRDLIELYMEPQPWGDFGIDLALGADIDRKATAREYMFLPDFVFEAFTSIQLREGEEEKPIVKRTEEILLSYDKADARENLSPFQLFSILLLLVLFFTYRDHRKDKRNKVLDFLIFLVTGVAGLVMLLLWFATDHTATVNNFNVLWAFAPNLIFAFLIGKNARWNQWYLVTLLLLLDLLVVLWLFKVQVFHYALIPILAALYVRYIYLWRYYHKRRKEPS